MVRILGVLVWQASRLAAKVLDWHRSGRPARGDGHNSETELTLPDWWREVRKEGHP